MSRFGNAILTGSLLLGGMTGEALAQSELSRETTKKETSAEITETTATQVQKVIFSPLSIRPVVPLAREDEKAYTDAVDAFRSQLAGRFSINIGESGATLGLGSMNMENGPRGGALVIKNDFSLKNGTRNIDGKWEAGIAEQAAFIKLTMRW